jgi:hypothetical protein
MCKECRKAIRRKKLPNQILTVLIPNIDPDDFLQLEQAIFQYLQIGNIGKAKFYLSTAKKLARSRKDKWLIERIHMIEEKIRGTDNFSNKQKGLND